MFRLVINPSALRCVQPSLAVRSFVSTSFSRLPAKPALPTSITAKTGSGRGGKVDKVAAAEAKALRLELKAAKAALAKVKADDKLIKTQAAKASVKAKAKQVKDKAKVKKDSVAKKASTKHVVKAPKAPQNSWQIFLQDATESMRKSLPEGQKLPLAAKIATETAPAYRALDSDELSALQARASAERSAYPAKLQEWLASLSPAMIKEENIIRFRRRKLGLSRARNLHRIDEPKRPLSAYFAYCADVRYGRVNPGAFDGLESDVRAQSKVLAAGWKGLTEEERDVYRQKYNEASATYASDKKAFDAKHSTESDATTSA